MPRTVEGIVACHEEATRRRNAGRPIWDGEIKIKPLMQNVDTDDMQQVEMVAKQAAAEIRRAVPAKYLEMGQDYDFTLGDIVEDFESITADVEISMDCVEAFDQAMDELYDWADRNRYWVA